MLEADVQVDFTICSPRKSTLLGSTVLAVLCSNTHLDLIVCNWPHIIMEGDCMSPCASQDISGQFPAARWVVHLLCKLKVTSKMEQMMLS